MRTQEYILLSNINDIVKCTQFDSLDLFLLLSDWVEHGTATRWIADSILLPSGVAPGQFSLRVIEDRHILLFILHWLSALINFNDLQQKRLHSRGSGRIEPYHLKLTGFENFLKSCRSHNTEGVESTARVEVSFQVQTHIFEKYNLRWTSSSATFVYLELLGNEEHYGTVRDDNSFEICLYTLFIVLVLKLK